MVSATDRAGNTSARSVTYMVLGPMDLLGNAPSTPTNLGTGNKEDDKKIDRAAQNLRNSLDASLWVDAMHLDPKQGYKVFSRTKDAIKTLEELINDKKVPLEIKTTPGQVINAITATDRLLAQIAINGASDSARHGSTPSRRSITTAISPLTQVSLENGGYR